MGFAYVASAPLVRSSYKAAEVYVQSVLKKGEPGGVAETLQARLDVARKAAARIKQDESSAESDPPKDWIAASKLVRRDPTHRKAT